LAGRQVAVDGKDFSELAAGVTNKAQSACANFFGIHKGAGVLNCDFKKWGDVYVLVVVGFSGSS
jgi:hypothetical protein